MPHISIPRPINGLIIESAIEFDALYTDNNVALFPVSIDSLTCVSNIGEIVAILTLQNAKIIIPNIFALIPAITKHTIMSIVNTILVFSLNLFSRNSLLFETNALTKLKRKNTTPNKLTLNPGVS